MIWQIRDDRGRCILLFARSMAGRGHLGSIAMAAPYRQPRDKIPPHPVAPYFDKFSSIRLIGAGTLETVLRSRATLLRLRHVGH
jgi:hypothetical protein